MNALQLIGVTLLALGFIVLLVLWLLQKDTIASLEEENNHLVDQLAAMHESKVALISSIHRNREDRYYSNPGFRP